MKEGAISKEQLAGTVVDRFGLMKERSVYAGPDFSVRFSAASGSTFSNTVLSLSALRKYDDRPFVVCVVRPNSAELLLANSTLLKRVSHSSHDLRIDNVRGSFNGSDIFRTLAGISNEPDHFSELFDLHAEIPWEENLERLVETTNDVVSRDTRAHLDSIELRHVLEAPVLHRDLIRSAEYVELSEHVMAEVQRNSEQILTAAGIRNPKVRGERIEEVITGRPPSHGIADLSFGISGSTLLIDVKSKLKDLSSRPKGFNVDKLLTHLGLGNRAISYLFVSVDVEGEAVRSAIVSVLDRAVVEQTTIVRHWAGRGSRGVTQLSGDLEMFLRPNFREEVEIDRARSFLSDLLGL